MPLWEHESESAASPASPDRNMDDMDSFSSALDSPLSMPDDLLNPSACLQSLDDVISPPNESTIESRAMDSRDTSATSAQRNPKKRNYDPNKARTNERRELQRLRVEVNGLELKLQQLQAGRGRDSDSLQPNTSRSFEEDAALPAVWEAICARQFERRLRAEQENDRLKKRQKTESKLIQSIEKLLFKRLALQNFALEVGKRVRRVEIPTGFVQHLADRTFQELETGVEVAYRDVESVLETNYPFPTALETQEPLLREGVGMELFDSRVLPFGVHATGNAWWRRWQDYRGRFSCQDTGDVISERCGMEMVDVVTDKVATFYVQQVLRRYVEDQRVVIVWNAYMEPFTFGETRVHGVHFLLKGCALMKPVERNSEAGGDSGEATTRVVTCYNFMPHFSDPKVKKNLKTNELTKFVVSATSANISVSNEMMENLLVDEALQMRR